CRVFGDQDEFNLVRQPDAGELRARLLLPIQTFEKRDAVDFIEKVPVRCHSNGSSREPGGGKKSFPRDPRDCIRACIPTAFYMGNAKISTRLRQRTQRDRNRPMM